jgi:hypothetical protein
MDIIAYHYRAYGDAMPETCDAPGCEQAATIEIATSGYLFCSTECADRTL